VLNIENTTIYTAPYIPVTVFEGAFTKTQQKH